MDVLQAKPGTASRHLWIVCFLIWCFYCVLIFFSCSTLKIFQLSVWAAICMSLKVIRITEVVAIKVCLEIQVYFTCFKISLEIIFLMSQPPSSAPLSFYQKNGMLPSGTWTIWLCCLIWDMIIRVSMSELLQTCTASVLVIIFCHLTLGIC